MEEETQTSVVHSPRFGKGQGFAHKACEPLTQRVIPPLDVSCCAGLFATGIRLPEIGIALSCPIAVRDRCPQLTASHLTAE